MKVTKDLKKKYPQITFGKSQKAWKCDRSIKDRAPFKLGEVYSTGGTDPESWACIEEGATADEATLQQVFNL